MQDIHPVIIRSLPQRNLQLTRESPATRDLVRHELRALLATTAPLSDVAEAKVQLQLLQFFMARHLRDAAYLAAENAEQSLANIEDKRGDNTDTNDLSAELDTLKARLRREMPFTFNSL